MKYEKHTTKMIGKVSLEVQGFIIPAFNIGIFLIRQIYDPVAKYRNTDTHKYRNLLLFCCMNLRPARARRFYLFFWRAGFVATL